MIQISPSMLSCDFSCMGSQTQKVTQCGADMIHLDVMDGIFVPNITFGAPVIKAIRKFSDKIFDVHLMIQNPIKYIDDFANAGADLITFHFESDSDVNETIDKIHSLGKKAGVSIKPNTPADVLFPYLEKIDMILVMTVEPGFGGQSFMSDMLPKIRLLKEKIASMSLDTLIQVDGGIDETNIAETHRAGADVFAVGSTVFKAEDMAEKIRELKILAEKI